LRGWICSTIYPYYITQIERENDATENEQYPDVPFSNKTLFCISKRIFNNFATIQSAHLFINKFLFAIRYSYTKTSIKNRRSLNSIKIIPAGVIISNNLALEWSVPDIILPCAVPVRMLLYLCGRVFLEKLVLPVKEELSVWEIA
jgi:hypothetical protein